MPVATLEKEVQTEIAYPEIPGIPPNFIGFCPLMKYTPGGWPPDMPKRVRQAIAEAVPMFGMAIRVFYPERVRGPLNWDSSFLWRTKVDPLVIGEKDGKYYLIAAWD
jgi:hypothetical protein